MKLNNHGWGYKSLIIWSSVFIIALLIASLWISNLVRRYNSDKKSDKTNNVVDANKPYYDLENIMRNAGIEYASNHNTLITLSNAELIIPYDELYEEGYLDKLMDPKNEDECTGYVVIKSSSDTDAYIKCSGYITEDYYSRME